jgi:proteasome lid subunit RPN8/RPN11
MEEIRAFACDELLQLSHAGQEVGGVLFGTRRDDLIRILTWRPIACEHTEGEGLTLSPNDRLNLAVQLEVARQNPDLKDLKPLGWFVSHPRAGVSLSPSNLEIYNGFFPEAWQVALVISPQGSGRAQAGFFFREAEDKLHSEASYQCFDLEPLEVTPIATIVATPEPKAASLEHAKYPPAREIAAPSFQLEEKVPTHERWLWAICIVLALGIAAFLLYQRRAASPGVAIALRARSEARTVDLTWDANSRAVLDSDHAAMEITDGGKISQISLSGDQLHAGKMSYRPQSGDISFAMTVYPASGEPIHDSTRLIAPALNEPTQPPQLLPANPPVATVPPSSPAIPPAAEQDALERQNQKLKEDLGKERARAAELQNLVRILEDRLGIPAEDRKAPRH